jgi:hypothetical protein
VQYINPVLSGSSSFVGLMAVEVSGNLTSACIDQTASANPASATNPLTSGSYTTGTAQEFAVGFANDEANCQTFSNNGGNTALTTPSCTQTGMGGVYQIYSTTQTGVTFKIGISPASDPMAFTVATFK